MSADDSPHAGEVTPVSRLRVARRSLEELALRRRGAEPTQAIIAETSSTGVFWLAVAVSFALVAARVTWCEIAGQTARVEGIGGLWHTILSAPSEDGDPRVEVQTVRTAACEAAKRGELLALAFDGSTVHVDAWAICAALAEMPPLAQLSTRLIGPIDATRWVRFDVVSGGSWGVVAVPEVPSLERQLSDVNGTTQTPAARPAAAREAPRYWPAAPTTQIAR